MWLAALGPKKPLAEPSAIAELWSRIGVGGRIAIISVAVVVVGYLIVRGLKRLGKSGRRTLLFFVTGIGLLSLVGFGTWVTRLPEPRGSYFVLWHQLVRIGAAVGGTMFVVGFMALAMPWLLDRIEGRGFISYVAARHVRSSKSGFLTVISVLSIAGVGVSSLALCVVISVMGGFGADLKRKILGNNAHIKIDTTNYDGFDNWKDSLDDVRVLPDVAAATPVAKGEAMASSSTNTAGVIVKGVDPESIGTVIDLENNIEVGKFEYLTDEVKLSRLPPDEPIGLGPGGELYLKGPNLKPYFGTGLDKDVAESVEPDDAFPAVILGRELAKTLHVYVGDEITLVAPLGDLGPMGVMPRTRKFRVAAIFYSGMYEYDASHVYMKLDVSQRFLDLEHKITGIEVRTKNAEKVELARPKIEAALGRGDLRVRDWKELNKNLFSALKLEKIATFIILSIAILVASFCIICTLLLMVTEKSKEIAILKALGSSDGAIRRIFMTEGMIIGSIGTVFGVVTGLALCLGLQWFGVRLDPKVYYVDRLPINVDPVDYTLIAIAALVITTLATVYPAMAASRLRPVDGIRYE